MQPPKRVKYPEMGPGDTPEFPPEYEAHPSCYTSLDPYNPGQACSDMGGGNEGMAVKSTLL